MISSGCQKGVTGRPPRGPRVRRRGTSQLVFFPRNHVGGSIAAVPTWIYMAPSKRVVDSPDQVNTSAASNKARQPRLVAIPHDAPLSSRVSIYVHPPSLGRTSRGLGGSGIRWPRPHAAVVVIHRGVHGILRESTPNTATQPCRTLSTPHHTLSSLLLWLLFPLI